MACASAGASSVRSWSSSCGRGSRATIGCCEPCTCRPLPQKARRQRAVNGAPPHRSRTAKSATLALELGQLLDRSAEGHDRGDRDVTGNPEQRLKLGLLGDRQRRDRSGEALVACGEEDVPHEGIDRRAADDADPFEILFGRRADLEVY